MQTRNDVYFYDAVKIDEVRGGGIRITAKTPIVAGADLAEGNYRKFVSTARVR